MQSVTQALGYWISFDGIRADVLAKAAERGSRVHASCAAYVQGLYFPNVPDDHVGFVHSFKTWFDDHVDRVLFCEPERLVDPELNFSGRPDLGVVFKGEAEAVLVDIKTPAVESPTWKVQQVAYMRLVEKCLGITCSRCMALQLKKDGGPAVARTYTRTADAWTVFVSALNCARYFETPKKERF